MYENSEAGILEIFMTMDINSNSWKQSGSYQSHLFIHMLQELSTVASVKARSVSALSSQGPAHCALSAISDEYFGIWILLIESNSRLSCLVLRVQL